MPKQTMDTSVPVRIRMPSSHLSLRDSSGLRAAAIASGLIAFALIGSPTAHAQTLYVSNSGNSTIEKFNTSGTGTQYSPNIVSGSINQPRGLALDSSGNLFIANGGNNTIEEISSSGTATLFTSSGLNNPYDLAFDTNGNLYAVNNSNNSIEEYVYNSTTKALSNTGTLFTSSGLSGPIGMAFSSTGNLYVSNSGTNTIEEYAYNSATKTLSSTGTALTISFTSGQLDGPAGLVFDSSGNLYIANNLNNKIEKISFTSATTGTATQFASGTTNGDLNAPGGLAIDSAGNLFVANNGDSTIEKYNTGTGIGTRFASGSTLNSPVDLIFGPAESSTPEPGSLALLGFSGVLSVASFGRRRRKASGVL